MEENNNKQEIIMFSDIDELKNHQYTRLTDNDNYKMIYYLVTTITQGKALGGIFCKIDKDGKIDSSEYKKIENLKINNNLIGFVKEIIF